MAESETQKRAKALLSRRADLETLRGEWRIVEDVLAGPSAMRTERYLPKHLSEHPDEYAKRKQITPVFSETPGILQQRQGALFREKPKITVPEALKYLFEKATLGGMNIYDVVTKSGELAQKQGFCGVLLDREELPADVQGRAISVAEQESRDLGKVYFAVYPASQILNLATARDGLLWVKLDEVSKAAPTWDAEPLEIHTIRIVTRTHILVFIVTDHGEGKEERYQIEERPPIPHNAKDAAGKDVVPFRFIHPFPAEDGFGRPILKGAAEADAAALWVLSELLWFAYMLCPILTLTTDREEKDIKDLGIGASRFIVLKSKTAQSEEEKLQFTVLDATAIDKLSAIWEKMVAKAKEAGGKNQAAAVTGPVEQSGISKAWTFKTSEERLLFLFALSLKSGFQWLLEQSARMTQGASGAASIVFPESFDIGDPSAAYDGQEKALELFERFGINAAVTALLLKMAETLLPDLEDMSWEEIEKQIRALADRELRPGGVLDKALNPAPDQNKKPETPPNAA